MIISFNNLKGGCGKSTSSVHICRYLLDKGYLVALVDSDSQATSSRWMEQLNEGIVKPKVFRLTDPDLIIDELPLIARNMDYTIIDGAGGLAEVQRATLLLADVVLIPIQPSFLDIDASEEMIKAVRRARTIRNGLPLAYTFLTRIVPNTLLLKDSLEFLKTFEDVPLLSTVIPQRQIAADVMGQGYTLFDEKSRPAKDLVKAYTNLFREVLDGSSHHSPS
ncbi:AAA family ATPase [Crocosphaera watsonii WH 8501]|uniref:Cobyrinic acid a,c-diamide synthase n=3 Tax=Crocosphaera watsonii TaxID=263511 RepID=Q4C996_CROWT|nr:ParA family protein [Crocosphaera watsonii]EAM53390.1 Cobyrinic acid a,c-diamide synthase [Crocosphaera watsonii WH 8501]CCQ51892.1 Chromosome (plasmid) partitioning protein ParA [Crocosphaera watsonii WH 8502]CCQ63918.1 putative partition protein [Crocosphaera watsonii WH 0401]